MTYVCHLMTYVLGGVVYELRPSMIRKYSHVVESVVCVYLSIKFQMRKLFITPGTTHVPEGLVYECVTSEGGASPRRIPNQTLIQNLRSFSEIKICIYLMTV